jgi:hypothetical protein
MPSPDYKLAEACLQLRASVAHYRKTYPHFKGKKRSAIKEIISSGVSEGTVKTGMKIAGKAASQIPTLSKAYSAASFAFNSVQKIPGVGPALRIAVGGSRALTKAAKKNIYGTYTVADIGQLVGHDKFVCTCRQTGEKIAVPTSSDPWADRKLTECDKSITWILMRKSSDNGLTYGLASLSILALAVAPPIGATVGIAGGAIAGAQSIYRKVRAEAKRMRASNTSYHMDKPYSVSRIRGVSVRGGDFRTLPGRDTDHSKVGIAKADTGELFITPGVKAEWIEDTKRLSCHACNKAFAGGGLFVTVLGGESRHHCRVCGEIYCGECSDVVLPVLEPLNNSQQKRSVFSKNPQREKTARYTAYEDQRVCVKCFNIAVEEHAKQRDYVTGPQRRAEQLIQSAGNACFRAEAVILAILQGDVDDAVATILSLQTDGAQYLVEQAQMK